MSETRMCWSDGFQECTITDTKQQRKQILFDGLLETNSPHLVASKYVILYKSKKKRFQFGNKIIGNEVMNGERREQMYHSP